MEEVLRKAYGRLKPASSYFCCNREKMIFAMQRYTNQATVALQTLNALQSLNVCAPFLHVILMY
jgi:hypothetical protein